MENKNSSNNNIHYYICVDSELYQVDKFLLIHPGGSVIKTKLIQHNSNNFNNELNNFVDGTEAFYSFHNRWIDKAKRILNRLPKVEDSIKLRYDKMKLEYEQNNNMNNRIIEIEYEKLRKELEYEGLFKPSYTHVLLRIIEVLLEYCIGFYLLKYPNCFIQVFGLILLGFGYHQMNWIHHESGHYSLTGKKNIDRWIQMIAAFCLGWSWKFWNYQHY